MFVYSLKSLFRIKFVSKTTIKSFGFIIKLECKFTNCKCFTLNKNRSLTSLRFSEHFIQMLNTPFCVSIFRYSESVLKFNGGGKLL